MAAGLSVLAPNGRLEKQRFQLGACCSGFPPDKVSDFLLIGLYDWTNDMILIWGRL
jgi:hypothetical protein